MDRGVEGRPASQLPEARRPSPAGRQMFLLPTMEENGYTPTSLQHVSLFLYYLQNSSLDYSDCFLLFILLSEQQLWDAVAKGLGAKRLAKMSRISSDGFRSPVVTMLLGEHSWVKHVDNAIK